MIVDTSALLAILLAEPEREAFEEAIAGDVFPRISAANYLEAGIVVDTQRNPNRSRILDSYIAAADIAIEPVTTEQACIARQAYRDYGRGSDHPAGLNFGDCMAHA